MQLFFLMFQVHLFNVPDSFHFGLNIKSVGDGDVCFANVKGSVV